MSTLSKAHGKVVLIVDDESEFRDAVAFDFKRKGLVVLSACNGKDAFELLRNEKVDLIISDVRMPVWSGLELLENLKKAEVRMPPVILLSGFSDLSAEQAISKGAMALLAKPIERRELHERVLRALFEIFPDLAPAVEEKVA